MEQLFEGITWYLAFLFSLVVHEAAHAYAALKLGDKTAYEGGQVTLNPLPHIQREKVGTIVFPILSYLVGGWMIGWASAPYDPRWALRYPKRSALMALAGPVSNLLIVIAAFLVIRVGTGMNVFQYPETVTFSHLTEAVVRPGVYVGVAKLVSILLSLNLLLFIFNLIPLPPLDGSGIVPLFLDDENARKYMDFIHNPSFMFIGLLIAWQVFEYLFRPVYSLGINMLYSGVTYT